MSDYYINSDKGKELANSLRAGDMAEASDGSTWRKESDGSITVIKNGQTMTGRVGVSAPAGPSVAPPTTQTGVEDVSTPVLSETQNTVADAGSLTQTQTPELQKAQGQQNAQQAPELSASEKAKEATSAVTEGIQNGVSNELLNQAIQQAMQPEYNIGSAKGVLMTDKMQKAGDMAEASDGSLWKRNEDGSITVTKDGKTYTATIDRDAAKRDQQWAVLTAPPGSAEETSTKGKGKSSSGSSSGSSGNYAATLTRTSGAQKEKQAQRVQGSPMTEGPTLINSTRGPDIKNAVKKNQAAAKESAEYTSLVQQAAPDKMKAAKEWKAEQTAKQKQKQEEQEYNTVQQVSAPKKQKADGSYRDNLVEDEKVEQRGGFGGTKNQKSGKVSEQEFNRSAAMVAQYGSYENYLRGVYAGYDEAIAAGTKKRAEAALAEGKVSEAEFSRAPAMVERYGTYRNYLNGIRRSDAEIGQERAQRRIESLGIADTLERYYNAEGEEQAQLRRQLATKGVTGQELNEWRNTVFNDAGRFIGDTATALFRGGMQQWQSGVEGALAGAESTANKVAASVLGNLANALPDGSLKNGLSRLSTELGSADSSHLENARLLQEQLGQTMQDTTQGHSDVGKWVIEQMPSMGNMLLNSASAGAIGAPSLATLGTTAGGSAYVDARNDGASNGQALAYGIVNGALEVGSEKLFGGNPLYDTDAGLVNKLVGKLTDNKTVMRILNSKGFDLLSEGLEEVVTEITEPWAQALIYAGKDADFATAESVGNAFLGGVFMSAVGNLAALPGQMRSREAQAEINDAAQSVFRQAMQSGDADVQNAVRDVQYKIATGAQLTVEDIGQVLEAMSNAGMAANVEQVSQDVAPGTTGEADIDSAIQAAMRGETPTAPTQATNQNTQKTTQPTAERGAEGVITGENTKKISMEDFANNESGVWNNVAYEDEQTKNAIMRKAHNDMIKNGEVVTIPESVTSDVASHFPDMRGVSKADRTPVLKQKLAELKTNLRRYLSGLKGASYEFDVNGNVLDARLYDTGIREVMDRVTQEKSNMLFGSDQIFRNAQYLYSTPDYDSNPNVYRWNYFYTPVQIGDQTVGVRIAVRDMRQSGVNPAGSQIYHWGIKKDAALDGGRSGNMPLSTDVSSAASFDSTVPQSPGSVNRNVSANDMGAMRSQFESVPKQSQTQSNTISGLEAEWNVPDAQRTPLYYDTISEAKSLDNARLRLAQDYAGEMAELRGKHNWSGEEVDMGMTILDNYRRAAEQTGDWTEYSNWRREVQAHGTAAGQALQAYAKYSRQTGGGIVADASAALERAAKRTNKAEVMNQVSTLAGQYDSAIGTGQENAKVNVNDLVDIIKSASTVRQTGTLIGNKTPPIVDWAMKRIANYAKAEAQSGGGKNLDFLKTFAADSIYNIAADTRAVSTGEKVKSERRMAMLSKVLTVMRNLVSNNVFDPVDSVARNISVPLDMLVSKITGTRSVALDGSWFSAAKRKGSMDGLARACMEVGLDVNTSGGAGKYENSANRTFKMSGGVVSKLMSTWEAYEGYTLNATDEFQKGGIEASVQKGIDRLYEQGKIKDNSLRDAGHQEALYRTFQDKTVLSDAAIGIRNALNEAHVGDIGAGDIILPFAQVPSNLGARAIEYSPAGLAVATADFINLIDSAKKGNFTAADQAKAVQGVGRALTGSGMIAIAAAGALRGWIKVTGDDDDKDKDALAKTHGLDGTQLNISAALRDIRGESAEWRAGDQLISIGFLDPINAQLTTGALIADDIRSESVTAGRIFGNSLSGALQSVLDTPVMSTLQDVATNYNYSDAETAGGKMLDAAQKYAANQLSSVIPNSLRGIAQGLDDTERNAYSSDNIWQQVVDNAKASIPGLRKTLPAKTDVWGNPIKNEGGVRNFMNRNVNPGFVTTYKQDDVSTELEKISEATNTSLYPERTAPRSLKVNGENISLTFEQRGMYQKAYGDAYSAAITALMGDKKYQSMPDSMKAEILKQAKDVATEQARDSLGIGYEMKTSAQKILDKSGADRNDALIAAAVKDQHYMSEDTQKQLQKVNQAFAGADYIGLSDEITNSAKEKANEYFSAVEAAKYGGELTATQKELSGKSSKELAQYFMEKAIESRFSDTNKNGTKSDEYLKAYENGEINDAIALSVLSDKEVSAYDRFGRSAKVTPKMALQAANAHAGIKDITDDDGKVITSAEEQFDAWLDKQSWTDDQKSAIRIGFYTDSAKTYGYLADQLRKGNIDTASAKSELSSSYQAGWTHNVKDTGAKMADYIDAVVEYLERPSEDERKAAEYKNAWSWFCDYLNTTSMTREQKFGIAISMGDYSDGTKQKIWDRLR